MTHRIREAMPAGQLLPFSGEGMTVEINETFIGHEKDMPKQRGDVHKHAVLTLVQHGGSAWSFHVDGTSAADLLPIIKANILPGAHVMTDEAGQHSSLKKHFAAHDFTRHGAGKYVRGNVHFNSVEGFYSVFKGGYQQATAPLRGRVRLSIQQPG